MAFVNCPGAERLPLVMGRLTVAVAMASIGCATLHGMSQEEYDAQQRQKQLVQNTLSPEAIQRQKAETTKLCKEEFAKNDADDQKRAASMRCDCYGRPGGVTNCREADYDDDGTLSSIQCQDSGGVYCYSNEHNVPVHNCIVVDRETGALKMARCEQGLNAR